ncbi:Soluble ligand binding domain protein [Dehalogenimonas lykanthroporepellens BL-DC-9]|jgi:competence protein ComEA|nr:Soluble ligand binding domain protein [Dehalogenimonas lykanthroporepellens BL-DC-9]
MLISQRLVKVCLSAGAFLTTLMLAGCGDSGYIEVYSPVPDDPITASVIIEGDVTLPGIYPLKSGDTIEDLLRAAGGLEGEPVIKLVVGHDPSPSQRVDLNTAPDWLLMALPGVGEAKAGAIIQYRETSGPFVNTLELMKVPGFAQATYDALKDLITVSA